MAVPNASDQSEERALRLNRLKQDIRQRLRNVISDWSEDEQLAIVDKIAESELLYTDAFLRRTRARLSPINGITRPIPEPTNAPSLNNGRYSGPFVEGGERSRS